MTVTSKVSTIRPFHTLQFIKFDRAFYNGCVNELFDLSKIYRQKAPINKNVMTEKLKEKFYEGINIAI